jgi:hypothetical protein
LFYSAGGSILLVVQLACLVHVIKTGRPYWWLWIIFMFPGIGLLAYVFLEVRPSLSRLDYQGLMWKLTGPRERIRMLEEQLGESTTIKNRLRLADELHGEGQFDRECAVLAEGLRGAFKDDSQLLMRLAEAHLEAGRTEEADKLLASTTPERSSDAQLQYALLKARVAGKQGDTAQAAALFEELVAKKKSEAPRYYFAEFLLAQGKREEAAAILKDILLQYRRGTPVWRHLERKWFYAAKRLVKKAG